MRKGLRVTTYILLGLIGFIILAGILVPVLFKDDIKKAIDDAIAENVNAEVYFDVDKFDISVFKNFPNVTVTLNDFGIIGVNEFKGDTLAAINSFRVVVDIMSVINDDEMVIKGIHFGGANIHVIVNEKGLANYDIAKPTEEDEESTPFNLDIAEFVISKANIIYDDRQSDMFANIQNLNYNASISLSEIYKIISKGNIEALTYEMDGITYLNKGKVDVKFDSDIDLENMKFVFRENQFKLNDFSFGFNGSVEMPDTATTKLDITFGAKETEFKNILSLVPGVFLEGFETLKTSGSLKFDGYAKGELVGEQIPTFGLNLFVENGMFQYPDLPTPVENVQVDLMIRNPDGILDNTIINLRKFHVDMGNNPVDAMLVLKGLTNMDIDGKVVAKINLNELNTIYPIKGLQQKGQFYIDAKAKGVYSEAQKRMPAIQAEMRLQDGYVKSEEFPVPLENIQMQARAFSDGVMENSWFKLDAFDMLMDGEQFSAKADVKNFDDINYDFSMNGVIDITKMMKIYPLEDMTISGIVDVKSFNTKGKMSDVEAENYMALTSSGAATVKDFFYSDVDLPQGFKITSAAATLAPSHIELTSFDGFIGKSDMQLSGKISNYMGYLFSKTDTVLNGTLTFHSKAFDLNEWMTEEEIPEGEEIPLEVVPIPQNIDFVIPSRIDKLLYDNYDITNMAATIIVRDGVAKLEKGAFNMLGGDFTGSGFYDTRDMEHPKYGIDFKVNNLAVSKAYETFNTIQTLAPIAKSLTGAVNTEFHLNGELGQDMMPILKTLNGSGFFKFIDGQLKEMNVTKSIADKTGFKGFDGASLKDLFVDFSIEQGSLLTKKFPFDVAGVRMLVGGKSFIDGTIDYALNMNLPTGQVGSALTSSLKSSGLGAFGLDKGIDLGLGLVGPAADPSVKIKSATPAGPSAGDVVKARFDDEKAKREAEAKARIEDEKRKAEQEAKARIEAEKQKIEDAAQAKINEAKKKAEEEAKKKIGDEATEAIKNLPKPNWK